MQHSSRTTLWGLALCCTLLAGVPGTVQGGCPCWICPENCPDTCPCWTPAELAAIRTNFCEECGNWIGLGGPPAAEATCVQINGATRDEGVSPACAFGLPDEGWVAVWDQAPLAGHNPPGCLIYDFMQGIAPPRFVTSLTPVQAAACVADIVARGTATAIANPGVPFGCMGQCFPPECGLTVLKSRCSNSLAPCTADDDCDIFGSCTQDNAPCMGDGDCPPIGTCAVFPQPCYATANCPKHCSTTNVQCVDETACPGTINNCIATSCDNLQPQFCSGNPDQGSCDDRLAFTHQAFDLVSGLRSDLALDGDFSSASCAGVQTPVLSVPPYLQATVVDPTAAPPLGDARYYLTRALEGVSCLDHGDSSVVPDPREVLDATCP